MIKGDKYENIFRPVQYEDLPCIAININQRKAIITTNKYNNGEIIAVFGDGSMINEIDLKAWQTRQNLELNLANEL